MCEYIINHPLTGKLVKITIHPFENATGYIVGVYGEKSEETGITYFRADIDFEPILVDPDFPDDEEMCMEGCSLPLNVCELIQ